MKSLSVEHTGPVAFVTIDRPEIHNAFDGALIEDLTSTFTELGADNGTRVIVLAGAGKSFCAGADLGWMRSSLDASQEENLQTALTIANMFELIDSCPKPVLGRVQGAAIGGGCGLVAVCDVVVAGPKARFGLSEVRLGMAPAVISPFVVRKIGKSHARHLFLTGERIDADRALQIGLVHKVAENNLEIDELVIATTEGLLKGGPQALAECKELARFADEYDNPGPKTAQIIARLRVSDEGQEGMRAFLDKRPPDWLGNSGK
jgi:methylglutaconyl-CoA hydratase